ncbi:rhodanese-like domain-containing protein [Niallia taxi]|uniref:Rhodanese-like domain-containing protein n=1 Tax=Niallia taxi TaxID=2499688 RepID=A0A437K721_9BACI|nr:rhodanese-like domain-containing protein [Niallia taxi]MDK8643012.1 rhodanese-like domain-containing protein [Niallia taxi]MED4038236.1 rhodanese-like domain-containing protein [Niallia taxi]MED4055129.1 rhodanese-like domain-containing protein [Niallia taxi]MED4120681.1 rhodanese-like domain-containing protein [Niallia taxi]RVT59399.1 rhodanese-like domain-containing protein [Niallia taxi]
MKQITVIEVETLLNKGKNLNIIDVREADEIAAGKIPSAVNIPLSLVEFRMHELDKSKEYIMVCRSGARSGRATQILEDYGFNVINMTGGMLAWEGKVE